MATEDISRYLFQPRKRYSGVRMQQGRVLLDSDWNEDERIDSEEIRRTLIDIVCAKGSSNQGFLVLESTLDDSAEVTLPDQNETKVETYNFDFANGSFYLGGLRFETETDAGMTESLLLQQDWLQIDASASNLPQRPSLTGTEISYDLVYLRGWEQCVTAVEDRELHERALGGPDTSVRIRRMRRVEVLQLTNEPKTCAEAFSKLQQMLSAPIAPDQGTSHPFDEFSCQLRSKALLTVAPDPDGVTDDPCKPAVASGYLGADNQAIRVQLTATDRFIWGYDNAAPLYRVQMKDIPNVTNGERRKLKFLTLPRDQMAHPLAGQAVELIPWGAILPNREKVAEFQGKLFTVSTSYDPEDNSITIAQPVDLEWLNWLSRHNEYWSNPEAADESEQEKQQYLYLRLWTGGSGDEQFPDHQFTPDTIPPDAHVSLTGTGLQVKFSDYGLSGDFWVIAARPNTPDIVVPWELLDKSPPVGPRYFFAPLALIRWSVDDENQLQASVQDCRERFQPLCQIRGCCTVTVGKGTHGDFNSIQDALNYLPEDGGRICILPGVYTENVLIDENKRNITITGCGDHSRIISNSPVGASSTADPVFHIKGSQNIQIVSLAIEADDTGVGILIESLFVSTIAGDMATETEVQSREILLNDLYVEAATLSGIEVRNGQSITIRNCHICMDDVASPWPGIYFVGEDGLIESNVIRVQLNDQTLPTTVDLLSAPPPTNVSGRGGLQIGSTSEHIRILNNLIHTGIGNGITLGSVVVRNANDFDIGIVIGWIVDADDPCSPCRPGNVYIPPGQSYEDEDTPSQVVSAGDPLKEIHIEGNRIFNMGLNGIGVAGFFNLDEVDEFISVERLMIISNEIRQCLWRSLADIPSEMINSMGYGGISLADVENLILQDNLIEDNSPNHIEPICGIFILHGEGIDISDNRILNNGARTKQPDSEAKRGRRGGINIVFGIAPTIDIFPTLNALRQNGIPAIKIHNNIVSTPLGQALSISALGPVSVIGNQFTSRGVVSQFRELSPSFIAATVAIINLGLSNEFYGQLLAFALISLGQLGGGAKVPTMTDGNLVIPPRGLDDFLPGQILANGNVLFSNNQCVLDLLELEFDLGLTSIFIVSLDDISFHNNQCDSSLLFDLLISQVFLFGTSVRASDNRLKEGLLNALFSAITLGIINTTTDNQVTHCLLVRGLKIGTESNGWSGEINHSNIIFFEGFYEIISRSDQDERTACNILGLLELLRDFGKGQRLSSGLG